jgi:hypothetical protein
MKLSERLEELEYTLDLQEMRVLAASWAVECGI